MEWTVNYMTVESDIMVVVTYLMRLLVVEDEVEMGLTTPNAVAPNGAQTNRPTHIFAFINIFFKPFN